MSAARRRLFEILFDGKDEARQNLDFALKNRAEAFALATAKLDRSPDAEWTAGIAGDYQNATLGHMALRWEAGHAVLDTGDWKSAVGRIKDGQVDKLVLLDPPWVGMFALLAREVDGAGVITLDADQEKYVFARAATP